MTCNCKLMLVFELIGLLIVLVKVVKYVPVICSDETIPCSVLAADTAEHGLLCALAWKYRSVQLVVVCVVSLLNVAILAVRPKCCSQKPAPD
jgi:hypothetical protein